MKNAPLEIEYKFLIHYPNIKTLESQPHYKYQEITQLYLMVPEEDDKVLTRCRIRQIKNGDNITYIKTYKKKITDMTRVEIESEISRDEFNNLSKYIIEGHSPLSKIRHSFNLNGFTYEVDVFPFWKDRAFLEIEVESEDIKPPVPPFLSVVRDVTADPRYRNFSLSHTIITENLE